MRPLPGSGATSATGASGDTVDSFVASSTSSQMTFVLTDDPFMDESSRFPPSPNTSRRVADPRKTGSRSRALSQSYSSSAMSESACSSSLAEQEPLESASIKTPSIETTAPAVPPITPPLSGLSAPASALGSPSSRHDSFAASLSEDQGSFVLSTLDDFGSASIASFLGATEPEATADSQLIMPTISVPTRRPFTAEGKSMGRLKVLVAGHTGTAGPASQAVMAKETHY